MAQLLRPRPHILIPTNIVQLNAKQTLQTMTYSECTDFTNFIINMHKQSNARALGSKITDKDFKDIISQMVTY